jgi:hypothetical protein
MEVVRCNPYFRRRCVEESIRVFRSHERERAVAALLDLFGQLVYRCCCRTRSNFSRCSFVSTCSTRDLLSVSTMR